MIMKKTGIRIGRRIYEVRSPKTLRFAEKIERQIRKLPNDLDGDKIHGAANYKGIGAARQD